jgi:hypothetical protein
MSTNNSPNSLVESKASTNKTFTPPKTLFLQGTDPDQLVGDEVAVCALVVKKVFPHVKFICDPQIELIWSNDEKSICGVVRAECAPPENIAEKKWWENARRWVSRQVAILRSSKTTQLKWSFMGKFYWRGMINGLTILTIRLLLQFG